MLVITGSLGVFRKIKTVLNVLLSNGTFFKTLVLLIIGH